MAIPPEILARILQCVHEDGLARSPMVFTRADNERVKNLLACSLVNRNWRVHSTRLLYSKLEHHGDENSFVKLWHFLRSILERPELATYVKYIDIQNGVVRDPKCRRPSRLPELSREEQRSRRQESRGLLAVGTKFGLVRLPEAIQWHTRTPIMAILMASLPNVTKLHLSADFFDNSINDRFFAKPFLETVEESKGLQNLSEVTFFDPHKIPAEMRPYHNHAITMRGLVALLLRPNLRKVELFDVGFAALSDQLILGKSSVTHLTIACYGNEPLSSLHETGLKACLQLPEALVSLSLYLRDFSWAYGWTEPDNTTKYDELWRILRLYRHTLVHLDLKDEITACERSRTSLKLKDRMGKLDDFVRLTTLRIQPEVLLGGISGIFKAPYLLRDALPPSLRSLTLYNTNDEAGFVNGKDLQMEVYYIVKISTLANSLEFFIIEDTRTGFLRHAIPGDEVHGWLDLLQQACSDRKIIFWIMSADYLPAGRYGKHRDPGRIEPEEAALEAWQQSLHS